MGNSNVGGVQQTFEFASVVIRACLVPRTWPNNMCLIMPSIGEKEYRGANEV